MTGADHSWRIWTANRADAETLVSLEALAFGAKSWGGDSVRESFVASRVTVLFGGAVAPGSAPEPAGPAQGFALWRDLGDDAELLTIGVVEAARRGGLGRALLDAIISAARANGAQRFLLEVAAGNRAARALYERVGFRDIGVRKRYYADGDDAAIMALSL